MEIEQTRDTIVKKLTSTSGAELEIMANITSKEQIDIIMEGLVDSLLGDPVGVAETERLLKLTVSMNGRGREDLTTLGRVPDKGWKESNNDS